MNNLWNQVYTQNGQIYYHNLYTNQTVWELPSDAIVQNYLSIPIAEIVNPCNLYNNKTPSKELREKRLKNARKYYCFKFW
tara:strand:- start:1180 stop:1419 length:240 start_codon:yes stop_codon:yes gene_type:complete